MNISQEPRFEMNECCRSRQEEQRARARSLNNVCRALRVPLTSIKGSAAALLDEESELAPAEQREYVRIIDSQADRIRGLVSELLGAGRTANSGLTAWAESEPFIMGDLIVHYDERRVAVAGRTVELTATEFRLLRALSLHAGKVVTFDSLVGQVWIRRRRASPALVRTYIKTLRHKLGDAAAEPKYIFSQRGVGYRLGPPRQS